MKKNATLPLTDAAVIARVRAQIARWRAEAAALDPRDARSDRERDRMQDELAQLTHRIGETVSALHDLDPTKGKTLRFVMSLEKFIRLATDTYQPTLAALLLTAANAAEIADIRLGLAALEHGTTPIGNALTRLMQVDYPPVWGGPTDVWDATGADAHGHAHGSIAAAQARLDELRPRVEASWKVIEEALREAEVPAPAA